MSEVTGLLKDIARVISIFIGGAIVLVILLFVYLDLTKTPDADVQLGRVDRDTTFYVGTSEGNHEGSGRISVLATGLLDASTASVVIGYPKSQTQDINHRFFLQAGPIDSLYRDDFYDSRAKVTYRHGTVKRGQLRLRVALGFPPEEWGQHPDKSPVHH